MSTIYDKPRKDYFNGVAPSDLKDLSDQELYVAAYRIADQLQSGAGTEYEIACAAEALEECYRERNRRRFTIH